MCRNIEGGVCREPEAGLVDTSNLLICVIDDLVMNRHVVFVFLHLSLGIEHAFDDGEDSVLPAQIHLSAQRAAKDAAINRRRKHPQLWGSSGRTCLRLLYMNKVPRKCTADRQGPLRF